MPQSLGARLHSNTTFDNAKILREVDTPMSSSLSPQKKVRIPVRSSMTEYKNAQNRLCPSVSNSRGFCSEWCPLPKHGLYTRFGGKWSLKTNTECSERVCIYESLLFHPKIFSMSTCSKQGDMNRALEWVREGQKGSMSWCTFDELGNLYNWIVYCNPSVFGFYCLTF